MSLKQDGNLMSEARATMSQRLGAQQFEEGDKSSNFQPMNIGRGRPRGGAESIASLGSSMAQHARTLVDQFACTTLNDRTGPVLATELAEGREDSGRAAGQRYGEQEWRERRQNNGDFGRSANHGAGAQGRQGRSFREYTNRSVDV